MALIHVTGCGTVGPSVARPFPQPGTHSFIQFDFFIYLLQGRG